MEVCYSPVFFNTVLLKFTQDFCVSLNTKGFGLYQFHSESNTITLDFK